jgi:divalent metal cation (Fe/Co/Zn/Cd) transporter
MTAAVGRAELVKRALLVERVGILWMVAEGGVGVISGIASHSMSLAIFGLNSVLELFAGVIVYAQLRKDSRADTSPRGEELERKALWAVGLTLWLLCIYVIADAARALLHHRVPQKSPTGLAVAVAALILTPLIAGAKLQLGRDIPNRALVADAKETIACGWLSVVTVLGVGLNARFGWWWADSAAALAMLPFLVREGWLAIREARAR